MRDKPLRGRVLEADRATKHGCDRPVSAVPDRFVSLADLLAWQVEQSCPGGTQITGQAMALTMRNKSQLSRLQLRLGRTQGKLVALADAGADVLTGDAADPQFLADAFRGADAVYTLLPTDRRSPDYFDRQQQEGEAIAQAISESQVRYVVALSALGAELSENTGLITGLHAREERLKRLRSANVTLLRPVSFFENVSDQLTFVAQQEMLADSVAADLAIPMVATRDVADAAVTALAVRDWAGVVIRELLGPRDLTHAEVARILGTAIGRADLPYVQLSDSDVTAALVESGYSASFATLYVEMTRSFNEGRVQPRQGRTPANTTRTRSKTLSRTLNRSAVGSNRLHVLRATDNRKSETTGPRMPAVAAQGSGARPGSARG